MKCFIVLGMHRSATSLVAKGLNDNNVCMGQTLLGEDKWNPYGHFENVDFVVLNGLILNMAGGGWDNPPPESEIMAAGRHYRDEIKNLILRSQREPMWGWKDPRTTLTIKCYLPFLAGQDVHLVAPIRGARQVVKSLCRRNKMTQERAQELAAIYHERLMGILESWPQLASYCR